MNLFQRLFTKKQPQSKVRWIKAGALDAAVTTGETASYWSFATNANADDIANADARRTLRARCRYEYLNDPYAMNAARNLAIAVVGIGPRLQVHKGSEDVDTISIERDFIKWSRWVKLPQKLALAVRSLVYDGEAFFRFVQDNGNAILTNIELVDAGRVSSPLMGHDTDENVLDGVRYDSQGNVVSYTVARTPVNSMYTGIPTEYETVPGNEILHFFLPELPGQHRGLPLMQSALASFAALRRYNAAVIEAAETAACHAALIKTGHLPDDEAPADWTVGDEIQVPRRGAVVMPRGWDLVQLKPEQPTAQHGEFVASTLTGIGAGVGQPRNIISNDSSNYNYSSGRLDHQTYFRYVETIQHELMYILDEILHYFLAERDANMGGNDANKDFSAEWYFAELEHVDPEKEANTAISLINNGLMTRAEYFAKFGQSWEEQVEQMIKERKEVKHLYLGGTT